MSRKVLVTGGAGYVGSHLCKALAGSGIVPVTFDNLSSGHPEVVKWGPLIVGDLTHPREVRAALRAYDIEGVFHVAALANAADSILEPNPYFRNNVAGTRNLLEAMAERGVSTIVFSSSCAVYGTPVSSLVREDHPIAPLSPYGESKAEAENLLRWSEGIHGLKWAALRFFNAAGADPEGEIGECHEPETHLIPLAIRVALGHSTALRIFGNDYPTTDGTAIRDYVHVTDLAEANLLAYNYLRNGGTPGPFNLGSACGYSVREIVKSVEELTQQRVSCREKERRPGDASCLFADISKARTVLGWEPRRSGLDNIIGSALAWERRRHFAIAAE